LTASERDYSIADPSGNTIVCNYYADTRIEIAGFDA
jgi:hypothetical protein